MRQTLLAAALLFALPFHAHAATIVVDTASDDPLAAGCSLHEAIESANNDVVIPAIAPPSACVAGDPAPAVDRIEFAIPGAGPHLIKLTTPLPPIVDPVVIDGYTQPGATPNTLVESEDGSDAVILIELGGVVPASNELVIKAMQFAEGSEGSTLRGIALHSIDRGSRLLAESEHAVDVDAPNVSITGNFFSMKSSGYAGAIDDEDSSDSSVGNFYDIVVSSDAAGCRIGGSAPADRNLFAGTNSGEAITSFSPELTVENNAFGTDRSGEEWPRLRQSGVELHDGGRITLVRNTIVTAGSGLLTSGATPAVGEISRNEFRANSAAAIELGVDGDRVVVFDNVFDDATNLPLDLGADGATQNDAFDEDVGPNGLTNYPVLANARFAHGTIAVDYELDNIPLPVPLEHDGLAHENAYTVELYAADACHASAHGPIAGIRPIAQKLHYYYSSEASDIAASSVPALPLFLSATITTTQGTSEFSPCVEVADDGVSIDGFE